ncbi:MULTISPECIES: hypothetical protein [unclassified Mesorhizobium]|uniref:hypothetical protein n=1 Tax=unclassified Mesorhizobium TaxID=325217 RepID=UPI0032AF7DB0
MTTRIFAPVRSAQAALHPERCNRRLVAKVATAFRMAGYTDLGDAVLVNETSLEHLERGGK